MKISKEMLQQIISKLKRNKVPLKKALEKKTEIFAEIKSLCAHADTLHEVEKLEKEYARICKIILKANVKSGQNDNIKFREALVRRKMRLSEIPDIQKVIIDNGMFLSRKIVTIREYKKMTDKEIQIVTKKQERINNNYYVKL